jgi:RHS repeat-associated protein
MVVNSAGVIENESDYYPWGGELKFGAADGGNHYKFTGKERDAETGLDNFGARYYGSVLSRFTSPDPSGLLYADLTKPQALNLYGYATNSPISRIDPNGLDGDCTSVVASSFAASREDISDDSSPTPSDGGCDTITPPPSPPDIDPCEGKGQNCYTQEIADSRAGGLAIHDMPCLMFGLREVVGAGETPGEPNSGYGTVVRGTVIAAPEQFSDLIGTTNAHIEDPSALTGHPHILVQVTPNLRSTAFGRYQILAGSAGNMTDFSPAGQDAYADSKLKSRGSVRDASRGNIQAALADAGREWASMPGSPYGQPTLTLHRAIQTFLNATGACGSR